MKGKNYGYGACTFEGCVNWARLRDPLICAGHYNQMKAGKELKPLGRYKTSVVDEPGMRRCTVCDEIKDEDEFYERTAPQTGRQSRCKKCMIRLNRRNTLDRRRREAEEAAQQG